MPERESQFGQEEYQDEQGQEGEKTETTMGMSEIAVYPEKGAHLLSVVLKGHSPEWGNRDHDLAKLTEQYFSEHPLAPEIGDIIKELEREGIDEESLYYFSLTYEHPERTDEVFDFLHKHKEIQNPETVQQRLLGALQRLDSDPSFEKLEERFTEYTQEDINAREEETEAARERIRDLIHFFRPKAQTTEVKCINLMPSDFLYHKKGGKSFMFGEELVVMSPHEDSTEGQAHEFLHAVVNPVVDKLGNRFTEDQKRKVVELASGKLRQRYGEETENYHSLLSEGFIRTYLNNFEKGEGPHTYERFQELISQNIPDEKRFQEILTEDEALRQRCAELEISSLEELNAKSGDYFEAYEKDQLGEIIYKLYQEYQKESSNKPELTFEDFVLEKFPQYLEEIEQEQGTSA